MLYLDTETCGLHGFVVLIQHAEDDGVIKMWDVWKEPVSETLELLEWIASKEICGFNLAFDWFHLSKLYTTFSLLPDFNIIPEDHIDELAELENKARGSMLCLKPLASCDLMLHARRGPYQSLMPRDNIRVRRVPTRLAEPLRLELEKRVQIDDIYFAKKKDKQASHWVLRDVHFPDGEINPEFKNIVLTFAADGSLKSFAKHILGVKEDLILKFTDIDPDPKWRPKEFGYAPFAMAVGKPGKWNWAWPEVINRHISHWAFNSLARKYAKNDIVYTRDLHKHFDSPKAGDTDSELATMVGAVRWRGFKINIAKLEEQRRLASLSIADVPTAPGPVKIYLSQVMDELEQLTLQDGTGAVILESIAEWDNKAAAKRAQEVLDARHAGKEIELFDKLLKAGRFHASFKIVGARSGRMSGTDKLNPQGIKKTPAVRSCFPLADDGLVLCGGDFASQEVTIAEAIYNDPQLRKDILSGKSIHALFAEMLHPGMSYEEIMATKKTDNDLYAEGKGGVYAMIYGGNEQTLQTRLGVSEEVAIKAFEGFAKRYPGVGKARERIFDGFCSMHQTGGLGTAVTWAKPVDFIESLLGFPRYFNLENQICKELFELAQKPPAAWKAVRVKVQRRDRIQTAAGAAQSALYAAAFNIQASNMRAAANHEIQSTGGGITKELQRKLWDLQPCGGSPWLVQTMNVHDEVLVCAAPEMIPEISRVVEETVEFFRSKVPLLEMGWSDSLDTWADK